MTIKDLIKMLQRYENPERYDIKVKDADGNVYSIEDIESDEDGIFILVEN